MRKRHEYKDGYMSNEVIGPLVVGWVKRGESTWGDLCRACDVTRLRPDHRDGAKRYLHAETTELQRMLGLRVSSGKGAKAGVVNASIRVEVVMKLLDYMGLDPVDVDV